MQYSRLLALLVCAALGTGCATPDMSQVQTKTAKSTIANDKIIAANVKAALVADPEIGSNIRVQSFNGFVNLRGEVKTIELRRRANAIARQVDGVMSVDNYLEIGG